MINLLVHTCNKLPYRQIWGACTHYLKQGFAEIDKDELGLHKTLACETLPDDPSPLLAWYDRIHQTGFGPWGWRLLKALGAIPSAQERVFYVQEDMWPTCPLPGELLLGVDELMRREPEINCVHIAPNSKHYTTEVSPYAVAGHPLLRFTRDSHYLMNHQPALWDVEFFSHYVDPDEDPWTNEKEATKRIRKEHAHGGVYLLVYPWYAHALRHGELTVDGQAMKKLFQADNPN